MNQRWNVTTVTIPNSINQEQWGILLALYEDFGCEGVVELGEPNTIPERAEFWFRIDIEASEAEAFLSQHLGDIDFEWREEVERDWNEAWAEEFRYARGTPTLFVGFEQYRDEALEDAPSGSEFLTLSYAPAFGMGNHPSTQLCLELLQERCREDPPKRLLDIGTGTGILSLAAAKWEVEKIAGVDKEESAIIAAKQNREENKLDSDVDFFLTDSADSVCNAAHSHLNAAPDLIVANMLLRDIQPLLPQLAKECRDMILSGLILTDETDLREIAPIIGCEVVKRKERGEWIAVVLAPCSH